MSSRYAVHLKLDRWYVNSISIKRKRGWTKGIRLASDSFEGLRNRLYFRNNPPHLTAKLEPRGRLRSGKPLRRKRLTLSLCTGEVRTILA